MKTFGKIFNFIGSLISAILYTGIAITYIFYHREPNNFEIFLALLLYLQFFIKHETKE